MFFAHGGIYKTFIAMVHEFLGQKRRDLIVVKCVYGHLFAIYFGSKKLCLEATKQ